jgi:hypothetical protein
MSELFIFENKEKGERFKLVCRKCQNQTWHEVLMSLDIKEVEMFRETEVMWENTSYQVIRCIGCDDVSFRSVIMGENHLEVDEETGEEYMDEKVEVFPKRISGRKIIDSIYSLPLQVKMIYSETHAAICNDQRILAGRSPESSATVAPSFLLECHSC